MSFCLSVCPSPQALSGLKSAISGLKSAVSGLKSERADFRPERADFRPKRTGSRPERADFRPERTGFRSDRADFRPERAWGDGQTDKQRDISPPPSPKSSLEAQIPALRLKSQPQGSNPSLGA